MKSNTEAGQSKNLANLNTLIEAIVSYGEAYAPQRAAFQLPALRELYANALQAISATNVAFGNYTQAITNREKAFEPLSTTARRVVYAIKASEADEHIDAAATTIVKKIVGGRKKATKTDEEKAALMAEGKTVTEISTSQMSFDNRLGNFDKLIALLSTTEAYNPNENDLKVDTLKAFYNALLAQNERVATAANALADARMARNVLMYKPATGAMDIANDVKLYIKSVFGPSSVQFNRISKLKFINY